MAPTVTLTTAWTLGLSLPGVEEGTTYGTPALKVRGHVICCVPTHRSAEPDSLVVNVEFDERAELLAAEPDTYYLPDHYADGPFVLVRLSRIRADALHDLLLAAQRRAQTARARRAGTRRR